MSFLKLLYKIIILMMYCQYFFRFFLSLFLLEFQRLNIVYNPPGCVYLYLLLLSFLSHFSFALILILLVFYSLLFVKFLSNKKSTIQIKQSIFLYIILFNFFTSF